MSDRISGPVCQSCGMPLAEPADHGTSADGQRCEDYCHQCFQNGAFTEPSLTMTEMRLKVIRIMSTDMSIPVDQAESIADQVIPPLKRWKN